MKAINITAYIEDDSQIEAIRAVIKAFKIKYRISKPSEVSQKSVSSQKKKDAELKETLIAHSFSMLSEKLG